jgi:hypothetical protein
MIVTYTTLVSTKFLKCHDSRIVDLDTEYSCTVGSTRPVRLEVLFVYLQSDNRNIHDPQIVKG